MGDQRDLDLHATARIFQIDQAIGLRTGDFWWQQHRCRRQRDFKVLGFGNITRVTRAVPEPVDTRAQAILSLTNKLTRNDHLHRPARVNDVYPAICFFQAELGSGRMRVYPEPEKLVAVADVLPGGGCRQLLAVVS
ncbi:hypothetical protein D3C77_381190 [compost metagenome]